MAFTYEITQQVYSIFQKNYTTTSNKFFEIELNLQNIDKKTIQIDKFKITFAEAQKIVEFTDEEIKIFFSIIDDKTYYDDDYSSLTSIIKETYKIVELKNRSQNVDKSYPRLQLFQGDCREALKNIGDNIVDVVVTDPPYGINFKPCRDNGLWEENESPDFYFDLLDDVCKELVRVTKKNSHLYIFSGWKGIDRFKQIIEKYFDIQNILIYKKNNHSLVDFSKRYAIATEPFFYCTHKNNKERSLTNKISKDVLEYSRVAKPIHSCEKPVPLLEYIIKNSSVENEIILDCFMGSGASAEAALKNNRKYIGCELEQEYFDRIKERLRSCDLLGE